MDGLETIVNGWPLEKRCLPSFLTPYWDIRDEMSVADGVVCRGTQAIIPSSMQKEMLKKFHYSHLGAQSWLYHE